jgi:hypothetical protein
MAFLQESAASGLSSADSKPPADLPPPFSFSAAIPPIRRAFHMTHVQTISIRSDPLPKFVPQLPSPTEPSAPHVRFPAPDSAWEEVKPYKPVPVSVLNSAISATSEKPPPTVHFAQGSPLARSTSATEIRQHSPPQMPAKEAPSHRTTLGVPDLPRPPTPSLEIQPPDPTYIDDDEFGRYGVRCVCEQGHHDGLLVFCDRCGFWLHGICVGVARARDEPFYCPFCKGQAIRCQCGDNKRYDVPIIQCIKCKFWVHKTCEQLKFGVVPNAFTCSRCFGTEFTLPHVRPDCRIPNRISFMDCDRYQVIQAIPEGQFRNFVIADLNRTQLHLHDTISRYFHAFAMPLFERGHDFWKVLVDTMMALLNCDKYEVLATLDDFAVGLLYSGAAIRPIVKPSKSGISESVLACIDTQKLNEVDAEPKRLIIGADKLVRIEAAADDDEFLCELPGFLMFTDELNADQGISRNWIRLHNTDMIVDLDGSTFQLAPKIHRSFHFNCIAKAYLQGGEISVGLFATKAKGPLSENRRRAAIHNHGVLMLPLDGDIPFPLPKCEWKLPRSKQKAAKPTRSSKTALKKEEKKVELNVQLSLLSAFCEDIVPPMPFNLVRDRESSIRSHATRMIRTRTRATRTKPPDDN